MPGELRLVAVGERLLDGEDDAVGDDGEEDGVLEGRPLDQELGESDFLVRNRLSECSFQETKPWSGAARCCSRAG